MTLQDRLRAHPHPVNYGLRHAAADALDALEAERDALQADVAYWRSNASDMMDQRDALRERVAELERLSEHHRLHAEAELRGANAARADRDQWKARCEMIVPLLRWVRPFAPNDGLIRDRIDAALKACDKGLA